MIRIYIFISKFSIYFVHKMSIVNAKNGKVHILFDVSVFNNCPSGSIKVQFKCLRFQEIKRLLIDWETWKHKQRLCDC